MHNWSRYALILNENNPIPEGLRDPKPERIPVGQLEGGIRGETKSSSRIVVRIERRSTHLLDPDNLYGSCKPLIDCLRSSELIDDDDSESIALSVKQSKVKTRKEHETIVEIDYGNP